MKKTDKIINWIRDYFEQNGKGCKAIVGVSGGLDSSLTAALLVKALGKENVIAVLIPDGYQHDIDMSKALVKYLDVKYHIINIGEVTSALAKEIESQLGYNPKDNDVYNTNTPSRVRMTVLYGICALYGGRVANTCNLSEDYIGFNTKFGDSAGDFSVLSSFTKTECKDLAREIGLPEMFVEKVPEDGMSGKTDEEKFGFSYKVLDHYIRTGEIEDQQIKEKIDRMHKMNLHKLLPMPGYKDE